MTFPRFFHRAADPQRGESRFARFLRWQADRRHLAEMDDRLLRDVGLSRYDVLCGAPFRDPAR